MTSRDIRHVGIFLVLSFGLAWLIALPLWLGEGLLSPWLTLVAAGMMFTPTVAALIVVLFFERPQRKLHALGMWPLKPAGRFILYLVLGLLVPIALVLGALPIGAALGVFPADFQNFSAFAAFMDAQLAPLGQDSSSLGVPIGMLVAMQLLNIPIGAAINLIPAAGEEIGWRGWLLPKLLPLGTVPALLISGLVWALWHSPLILLGYNYPGVPGWLAVLCMTAMCILVGAVFAWLRIRSDSVWPAALAHGSLNAAAGSFLLFAEAGATVDTTQATILGWSGWIIPLALVIVLLATGQFRAPKPVSSEPVLVSPVPDAAP